MSKESLQKVFEKQKDPLREIYRISQRMLESGLMVDLSAFQKNKDHLFFEDGFLHFSSSIKSVLEGKLISTITYQNRSKFDYQGFPRDYSLFLEVRHSWEKICLYEDSVYSLSFYLDEKPLGDTISWSESDKIQKIKVDETEGRLYLKIKQETPSELKKSFLSPLNHKKTQGEITQIFSTLCKRKHYFQYLPDIFGKVKKIPSIDFSSFESFLIEFKKESPSSWSLDFYDWAEVLFGFSVIGNYKPYVRAQRIKHLWILRDLKDEKIFKLYLSSKDHRKFSY